MKLTDYFVKQNSQLSRYLDSATGVLVQVKARKVKVCDEVFMVLYLYWMYIAYIHTLKLGSTF